MKKLLPLFALLAFVQCDRCTGPIFHPRFIDGYCQGELHLEKDRTSPFLDRVIAISLDSSTDTNRVPVIFSNNSEKAKYDAISVRNNDLAFNYTEPKCGVINGIGRPKYYAFADNFSVLHITSDTDWDAGHPAGTPLDELATFRYSEYGTLIRNGYKDASWDPRDVRVSDLRPKQMEIIAYSFESPNSINPRIILPPLTRKQTLTVEWTTTEGDIKRASIVMVPKGEAPDDTAEE